MNDPIFALQVNLEERNFHSATDLADVLRALADQFDRRGWKDYADTVSNHDGVMVGAWEIGPLDDISLPLA